MADSYFEREREKDRQEWRRAAFIASWIINTAGKSYQRDVSANDLIQFKDEVKKEEVKPVSLEERKRQADETFKLHKQKFWTLFKLDEDGEIKVFDEGKLEEIKERYRKK